MPLDNIYAKLTVAQASNTGNAQDWMTAWDTYVVPVAGTVRSVAFVASSLASNTAVHQVDIFRQASGVSGASNSATTILTAPVSLASNSNAAFGVVSQAGARVAAGDILQLKTNEKLNVTGTIRGLTATVDITPD